MDILFRKSLNQHFALFSQIHMSSISLYQKLKPQKLKPQILFSRINSRSFCAPVSVQFSETVELIKPPTRKKRTKSRTTVKATNAQLKDNWLSSLTCPIPANDNIDELRRRNGGSDWVIGIDPDVSGALAVVKTNQLGSSAEVFDSPFVKILVGKGMRKRLDPKSIVQLVTSLEAPTGTIAYLEQSVPFPKDGKLGWWSGGYGYGLWIGILAASGFSVVPVPPSLWKKKLELSGSNYTKDNSRNLASELFPSLSPMLKRKKDHGRAEALLIATYGQRYGVKPDKASIPEELIP